MKKISLSLALAGLFVVAKSSAVSLDGIQFWIGSGTNRAALVIEWSTPGVAQLLHGSRAHRGQIARLGLPLQRHGHGGANVRGHRGGGSAALRAGSD